MTESLLRLSTEGFKPPKTALAAGAVPMLQWLATDVLVVDHAYQRPISGTGRKNVIAIAEHFEWSKFSPVVVAPIEGGLYAIIDGQHRTTAAMLRGITQVPCQVVIVDRVRQAQAFAAINGVVTAVSARQVHYAKLAAGDEAALRVAEVCRCAEVTILRAPRQASRLKRGETLAAATIYQEVACFGRDTVITALQCITFTGDGNAGLLKAPLISALCEVLHEAPRWREAGDNLLNAVEEIDLLEEFERAGEQRKEPGVTIVAILADRLRAHLERQLGPAKPGAMLQAAE